MIDEGVMLRFKTAMQAEFNALGTQLRDAMRGDIDHYDGDLGESIDYTFEGRTLSGPDKLENVSEPYTMRVGTAMPYASAVHNGTRAGSGTGTLAAKGDYRTPTERVNDYGREKLGISGKDEWFRLKKLREQIFGQGTVPHPFLTQHIPQAEQNFQEGLLRAVHIAFGQSPKGVTRISSEVTTRFQK